MLMLAGGDKAVKTGLGTGVIHPATEAFITILSSPTCLITQGQCQYFVELEFKYFKNELF